MRWIGFLCVALAATFGGLAHAQRAPEVRHELLLEVDGDQLLQSELDAALREVRDELKSLPMSGP